MKMFAKLCSFFDSFFSSYDYCSFARCKWIHRYLKFCFLLCRLFHIRKELLVHGLSSVSVTLGTFIFFVLTFCEKMFLKTM